MTREREPWFADLERRFAEAMTAAQEQRERMPEQAEFWRGREGAFYDALAWLDDAAGDDEPYLVHPVSGRRLPWHEHDWREQPYHDGATLRTCAVAGCPFTLIVPGASHSQERPNS